MPRLAYVNGEYAPIHDAGVNIEDRGYQFADGVYEVCLVVDGQWWDERGHMARLWRSLDALHIPAPMAEPSLRIVMNKLVRLNRLQHALVYIQVTRGVAPRLHPFPDQTPPSLVITARPFDFHGADQRARQGVSVITAPDIRWGRVDIKSVSLLPNVLAKQDAYAQGAIEAMLHRNEVVTEGASSNMWIISDTGELVTHPLGNEILGGITRETVKQCAERLQLRVVERPFTLSEAFAAKEAFLTSATNLVTPIIRIDSEKIGDGVPGALTLRLRDAYIDQNKSAAIGG